MKKIDAKKVASLSKEEKLKLYDLIQTKKRAALNSRDQFVPHAGQLPVLLSEKYIRLVTAGNGCWAPGTLVRMYDGSLKKVEEVKIGEELLGPDSLPRKVLSLASGIEEMYEITPKWGKPYTVNATHILSIYIKKEQLTYKEIMLRDWLELREEEKLNSYQWKPPIFNPRNSYEEFTVTAKGVGEYYGFELSGDGLLLLEDYTVNHNSGKTCLGVNQALAAAKGYNPWTKAYTKVPCTGIIVLDNPLKVSEVWLKEMNRWHDMSKVEQKKNGKPYVNELVFENGSRLIFMFWDQEEMVYESLQLDFAVYDEPPPRHIFIALSRGQRIKGSRPWQLIIGTPLAAAWLRQEIYEPWEKGERSDVECFRGTTEQNKQNLADGYMEQFGKLLTEEEKKIRFEGQWFDLGGLALKHLIKPEVHYIPRFQIEPHWPVVIAIDPHPVKAHVAVAITKDPKAPAGSAIAIAELKAKATARDFAAQLHAFKRGWKVVDIVCDSLGATDGTGGEGFKSFIDVLNTCGIKTRATTYEEKLDEDWIERIRNALDIPEQADNLGRREPKLKIFDDMVGLKKDLENVAWVKYRSVDEYKPKLDISNKDVLACLKYALAASNNLDKGTPGSMQSQARDLNGSVVRSNSSKSRGSFLRRMYKG